MGFGDGDLVYSFRGYVKDGDRGVSLSPQNPAGTLNSKPCEGPADSNGQGALTAAAPVPTLDMFFAVGGSQQEPF